MKNCWLYNGECLEKPPEGFYGFVYIITCIHPDYKGYIYIGKKSFTHKSSKKVTKKVIKDTKTRKRIVRGTKDSGWLSYYGSSLVLKSLVVKLGKDYFKREILSFATTKSDWSLQEIEYICAYKVLRIKESFNMWASYRGFKKYLVE